ncbi:winged helix-turn-helix domain-containing protein [Curtobacterium flaccumfaciens]|uniref:winged helix-turn-helix domain-containing protein n=1 Tax=Curtobacterium flaccumfaciens TaxID=2035 RepID=UPI0039931E6B
MKVLFVEDDAYLSSEISRRLRSEGYAVDVAATLAQMDLQLAVNRYDCLVLDRTLPDGDSLQSLSAMRSSGSLVPTLFLSARASIGDRLDGFDAGADDYLVKPFAFPELVARLRALTRRASDPVPAIMTEAGITMDIGRHTVSRDGSAVTLSAKEFAVLEALMRRPGIATTRTELIESCWDEATDQLSNVVDVVVWHLRRKLGPPDPIDTVRGVGYRLRQ